MSDKDTLALDPATTPLSGAEQVHIVQDGESRRINIGSIAALAEDPEAVFGAKWELVHYWQWSEAVAAVPFTGLGDYQEILVVGRDITLSGSSFRHFQLSTDNGENWFTTNGDYITIANTGVIANRVDISGHATANAAVRSVYFRLSPNIPGTPKMVRGTESTMFFVGSLDVINALRMYAVAGNITGGELFILGLR